MMGAVTARLSCAGRAASLVRAFERVERTRMAGVPVLNLKLRVEAVGFEREHDSQAPGLAGVLITPWFMNLIWLPADEAVQSLGVGATRTRRIGCEELDFIGAEAEEVGRFEACSIWSPMFDFEDHAAARATAQAVLDLLRKPVPENAAPSQPARRALLFGRGATRGDSR